MHMLSTVMSPVFSEVVIAYQDYDIRSVHSGGQSDMDVRWFGGQFKVFREMHKVRDFHLVLCADVWHFMKEYTVWRLKQAVAAERAKGGFGELFPEPLVIPSPRGSCPDRSEGVCTGSPIPWVPL